MELELGCVCACWHHAFIMTSYQSALASAFCLVLHALSGIPSGIVGPHTDRNIAQSDSGLVQKNKQ
jgi:hypothetical protein